MVGNQYGTVGVESAAKAAALAVLVLIFGNIFLGVLNSLLHLDLGGAFSVSQIQYAAIAYLSTAAVIASVLLVFVRGVEQELILKASGAIYGMSFLEDILRDLLRSSLDVGFGLFISPLYSVLTFFGYVIAFYVVFETDVVN